MRREKQSHRDRETVRWRHVENSCAEERAHRLRAPHNRGFPDYINEAADCAPMREYRETPLVVNVNSDQCAELLTAAKAV